jgi:hypothetical protein
MTLAIPGALTISNMASFQSLQMEVVLLFWGKSMILMLVEEAVCDITIGVA